LNRDGLRVLAPIDRQASEDAWKPLYRIGGLAAWLTAGLIPVQVASFLIWPPPLNANATEWFTLFGVNRLAGLVGMDLLLLIDYVLLIPIVIAVCVALRKAEPTFVALGGGLFVVAISAYFASNPAFQMLMLADQHAAAATDSERSIYLAAGQAMVANYTGTAFHMSYLLGSLAGILIAARMTPAFGRVAGIAGVAGNAVGLGLYLPAIGLFLGVVSGPLLLVWYVQVARGLLRLASIEGHNSSLGRTAGEPSKSLTA
jgi:hypothetical protein